MNNLERLKQRLEESVEKHKRRLLITREKKKQSNSAIYVNNKNVNKERSKIILNDEKSICGDNKIRTDTYPSINKNKLIENLRNTKLLLIKKRRSLNNMKKENNIVNKYDTKNELKNKNIQLKKNTPSIINNKKGMMKYLNKIVNPANQSYSIENKIRGRVNISHIKEKEKALKDEEDKGNKTNYNNNKEKIYDDNNKEKIYDDNNKEKIYDDNNKEKIYDDNNNVNIYDDNNNVNIYDDNNNNVNTFQNISKDVRDNINDLFRNFINCKINNLYVITTDTNKIPNNKIFLSETQQQFLEIKNKQDNNEYEIKDEHSDDNNHSNYHHVQDNPYVMKKKRLDDKVKEGMDKNYMDNIIYVGKHERVSSNMIIKRNNNNYDNNNYGDNNNYDDNNNYNNNSKSNIHNNSIYETYEKNLKKLLEIEYKMKKKIESFEKNKDDNNIMSTKSSASSYPYGDDEDGDNITLYSHICSNIKPVKNEIQFDQSNIDIPMDAKNYIIKRMTSSTKLKSNLTNEEGLYKADKHNDNSNNNITYCDNNNFSTHDEDCELYCIQKSIYSKDINNICHTNVSNKHTCSENKKCIENEKIYTNNNKKNCLSSYDVENKILRKINNDDDYKYMNKQDNIIQNELIKKKKKKTHTHTHIDLNNYSYEKNGRNKELVTMKSNQENYSSNYCYNYSYEKKEKINKRKKKIKKKKNKIKNENNKIKNENNKIKNENNKIKNGNNNNNKNKNNNNNSNSINPNQNNHVRSNISLSNSKDHNSIYYSSYIEDQYVSSYNKDDDENIYNYNSSDHNILHGSKKSENNICYNHQIKIYNKETNEKSSCLKGLNKSSFLSNKIYSSNIHKENIKSFITNETYEEDQRIKKKNSLENKIENGEEQKMSYYLKEKNNNCYEKFLQHSSDIIIEGGGKKKKKKLQSNEYIIIKHSKSNNNTILLKKDKKIKENYNIHSYKYNQQNDDIYQQIQSSSSMKRETECLLNNKIKDCHRLYKDNNIHHMEHCYICSYPIQNNEQKFILHKGEEKKGKANLDTTYKNYDNNDNYNNYDNYDNYNNYDNSEYHITMTSHLIGSSHSKINKEKKKSYLSTFTNKRKDLESYMSSHTVCSKKNIQNVGENYKNGNNDDEHKDDILCDNNIYNHCHDLGTYNPTYESEKVTPYLSEKHKVIYKNIYSNQINIRNNERNHSEDETYIYIKKENIPFKKEKEKKDIFSYIKGMYLSPTSLPPQKKKKKEKKKSFILENEEFINEESSFDIQSNNINSHFIKNKNILNIKNQTNDLENVKCYHHIKKQNNSKSQSSYFCSPAPSNSILRNNTESYFLKNDKQNDQKVKEDGQTIKNQTTANNVQKKRNKNYVKTNSILLKKILKMKIESMKKEKEDIKEKNHFNYNNNEKKNQDDNHNNNNNIKVIDYHHDKIIHDKNSNKIEMISTKDKTIITLINDNKQIYEKEYNNDTCTKDNIKKEYNNDTCTKDNIKKEYNNDTCTKDNIKKEYNNDTCPKDNIKNGHNNDTCPKDNIKKEYNNDTCPNDTISNINKEYSSIYTHSHMNKESLKYNNISFYQNKESHDFISRKDHYIHKHEEKRSKGNKENNINNYNNICNSNNMDLKDNISPSYHTNNNIKDVVKFNQSYYCYFKNVQKNDVYPNSEEPITKEDKTKLLIAYLKDKKKNKTQENNNTSDKYILKYNIEYFKLAQFFSQDYHLFKNYIKHVDKKLSKNNNNDIDSLDETAFSIIKLFNSKKKNDLSTKYENKDISQKNTIFNNIEKKTNQKINIKHLHVVNDNENIIVNNFNKSETQIINDTRKEVYSIVQNQKKSTFLRDKNGTKNYPYDHLDNYKKEIHIPTKDKYADNKNKKAHCYKIINNGKPSLFYEDQPTKMNQNNDITPNERKGKKKQIVLKTIDLLEKYEKISAK
ncbi:hypothetical protein PFHG_01485 [Plasmodium falciparum HB3]|uniref:Uncharacterized protein n=1 Tax=Plasmodium falciparum (isolate HB3) TaxID=137071 RepID=A0A0L7K9J6_PLAFX|nr:hypothetical protein PFHG_01485 [Plasmodium falciparum HB3]